MPLSKLHPPSVATLPWWIAALLWFCMASIAGVGLWHLRRDTIESRSRELALLSASLADEIERGLRGAEDGLRALRAELLEGRFPLTGSEATQALRTRADLMPLVSALWLVDGAGRALASSESSSPPRLPAFIPPVATQDDAATAIGTPFRTASHREVQISLALRMPGSGTAGEAGWILAALPSSALQGAFSAAPPTPDTRLVVFSRDGVRLAGADLTFESSPTRGAIDVRRLSNGTEVLVGEHAVPRHGLRVLVLHDMASILAPWRHAAEVTGLLLVITLASLMAGAQLLQVANTRRAEAYRALQARLGRASRLESLGTLASSVARDFNEVLAGIGQAAQRARAQAPPGTDIAHSVETVVQAAVRGQALVDRLVASSQGGAHARVVFELQTLVDEVLDKLAPGLPPSIELVRQLQAPQALVRGDPAQARESVLNLCNNAVQAMPAGGRLSVGLHRVNIAATRVFSHSLAMRGQYLALSVRDQGAGVSPPVMEHLFEPFFSTRGEQGAPGLGLAMVHGFVSDMDGAVDVSNEPKPGACFTLYVPEWPERTDPG